MPDLYRMFDRADVLLYVGISVNAGARAAEHAADKPWWTEVVRITVEHLDCDRVAALAIEQRAIRNERPKYNVQHNDPDRYVERLAVRPFEVPSELARSREWRSVAIALVELVQTVRHLYGEHSLADEGSVDVLGLIERTARAAHHSQICPRCAATLPPTKVDVVRGRDNELLVSITCTCHRCQTYLTTNVPWEHA